MAASVFFDTNVLVYAAIGTGKDQPKKKSALRLIETEEFGTSAQVLQEFLETVVRKRYTGFRQCRLWIGLSSGPLSPVSPLTTGGSRAAGLTTPEWLGS
jgi:hypothetical protein